MKIFETALFFVAYGIVWPLYVTGRARNGFMVLCVAAPVVSFFVGWYAK